MIDIDELAQKAKEQAKKIAAESGERFKNFRESEDFDQLREVAGGLGEEAAVFVRKYPIQSVAGALAIGLLIGASLGRKK
jgi:ElaB/YqjD/DUF883 family membrane-anchored ribosome-binding protein